MFLLLYISWILQRLSNWSVTTVDWRWWCAMLMRLHTQTLAYFNVRAWFLRYFDYKSRCARSGGITWIREIYSQDKSAGKRSDTLGAGTNRKQVTDTCYWACLSHIVVFNPTPTHSSLHLNPLFAGPASSRWRHRTARRMHPQRWYDWGNQPEPE